MFNKHLELGGEETALIDYRLGQALFFLNVYEDAIENLNKAVEKGIEKSDAYNLLAKANFRLRQYDEAFDAYDMYEEMESGGEPDYQWAETDFEFFKEKAQTLFQLYNEGRQEGTADSTYLVQAAEDYERAISLKPDDPIVPQLYVQLGLTYYYLGEYEKAIPWFEKKIEIDPDVYNTYLNLAYCYLKMEDFETAIDKMVKVTELNPEYCLAHKTIANSYLVSIKDRAKAAEWYKKWSECEPDSYAPYKWLGYLAISAKPARKDEAIRYLLIAVDKMQAAGVDSCTELDVLVWLAQAHNMYNDLDKEEQAVQWAKRGLKCDPDNEDLKQIIEELDF
jgi:tetratricopeptide (TPR) repeat protein